MVHLGSAKGSEIPDGIITGLSGIPVPRLLFVVLSSCVWTGDGEIERLSPAFLGLLLRCFAAQFMPQMEFSRALPQLTRDFNLNKACARTMCHTRTSAGNTYSACGSVYHEAGLKSDMDPRSRSPICQRCFVVEDNLRKATWPLVSTLEMRLQPGVYPEILKSLKTITRHAILKSVNACEHDLFLSNIPLQSAGHWLHRATPYAATLLSIQRSNLHEDLLKLLPSVVAQGWADMNLIPKRKKIGDQLKFHESILYSQEWQNIVSLVKPLCIKLVLVSPTYGGERVDSWTFKQLSEQIQAQVTTFCACTVGAPGQALNFLLDAATCQASVIVEPIDERHFYTGSCPDIRKHLDDEANGGWKRNIPKNVETLFEFIRSGKHERQGVQASLRRPVTGRKRRRKEGETHGKKPTKRTTLTVETTSTSSTGGEKTGGTGE